MQAHKLIFLLLCCCLVALTSRAQTFTNGSFEFASINPGGSYIEIFSGSTSITNWTVASGSIDYIGGLWNASTGGRSLDLNGTQAGAIRQSFSTVVGQSYCVTFDLAGNPGGGPAIKTLEVSAAGTSSTYTFDISGFSQGNMGWQNESFQFTATTPVSTLTFSSLTTGNAGPAIDNVTVVACVFDCAGTLNGTAILDSCGQCLQPTDPTFNTFEPPNLGADTVLCIGDTLLLDATIANGSYVWQDGSNGAAYSVSVAGTYSVQATNSCTTLVDTVVVSFVSNVPVVALGNDTSLCSTDSLVLLAANANANYLWQDGSTDSSIAAMAPGLYWVQVTTSCTTVTDSIQLALIPALNVNLGPDTLLCSGDTLLLNATNAASTYLWQDSSTNETLTANAAGSYWVEVTNTCATVSDTINIGTLPLLTVTLGNDTNLCTGDTIVLFANTPGTSYLWQDSSQNQSLQATQGGTYWVQVTDACSTVADTVQVVDGASPVANLGNDTTLCAGDTLLLTAFLSGASYLWQNGSSNPTFTADQSGTYSVLVTTGCGTATDTMQLLVSAFEVAHLGNDTIVCTSDTLLLDAGMAQSYQWSTNAQTQQLAVQSIQAIDTLIWVTATDGWCPDSDSILVQFAAVPILNLPPDTAFCGQFGLSVSIAAAIAPDTVSQWLGILWSTGDTTRQLSLGAPGTYWAQLNLGGCVSTDSMVIQQDSALVLDLGPDIDTCLSSYTVSSPYPALANLWSTGEAGPQLHIQQSGNYWLEVVNGACAAADTVSITLNPAGQQATALPTVFTPNGDGINDLFLPSANLNVLEAELFIYNRFGQLLLHSTLPNQGWDGRLFSGQEATAGTYFYTLSYRTACGTGELRQTRGSIMLLR